MCDFIDKLSANGTRVEIRKLIKSFASMCTYRNLLARGTDVMKWHLGQPASKMSNLRLLK